MAQPYNIGNLGQKLTVDLAGNNVSLSSGLSVGSALIANSTQITIGSGTKLLANGSFGTQGQVLTTNGSTGSPYWSTVTGGGGGGGSGTVTSIETSNGIGGGTISVSGTLYAIANTGIVANSTGLYVNATYIGTISSNNSSYLGGTAAASYQLNSTLNANIASYLPTYSGVVNASAFTTTGNANAANHYSGANALFSATSLLWTGNTTTSPTITLANTGNFVIGNSTTTQTTSTIVVANSTGNVQITPGTTSILATGSINAASHTSGATFTANATLVNAAAINITGQVNTATFYATSSANIASVVQANATGLWTTGTVNAASHTVGATFTANATLVNAAAINITGQVNTATFYATTSANIASAVQANATGVWTTGTVNAATHSVGAGFVANTTVLNTNTDIALTVNNKQLRFATVNALANSYFINQNDDNFVFYTTNTNYQPRAVFSIYANSITSNLNFAVRTHFAGGLSIPTGQTLLDSTGSQGTAGQVLTSNGVGNVYWSTVSGGGGGGTGTVTSVATGNGMTGGTITVSGTVSVLANTGIVANATGTFVNATYIGTISSNNASYLGGTIASSYQLNSTLNANIASYLPTYTGIVNASAFTTTGNANAASHYSGANALFSSASLLWTGNTTTSPTITLANTGNFVIGNSTTTQITSTITVANSTGNVQITPGTTSILATGSINAASHTVGTVFTANATMTNTVSLVVSTNTATIGTAAYHVSNGNFGIGTSTPGTKLVISPSSFGTGIAPFNKIRLFDDGANNVYGLGMVSGYMDIGYSGGLRFNYNSAANVTSTFASMTSNQLVLTGTDGTTSLLIAGATKAVRTFTNSGGTYIEGVDNTGVGSYQPLTLGGSTVSIAISNVEKFKVDSSGNVTMPSQPMCTVNHVASVTTYASYAPIQFTATGGYDPRSMFSVSAGSYYRITVPVAGRYMIHANFLRDIASLGPLDLSLKKNGTQIYRIYNSNWAGYDDACMNAIVNCAASDYFDIINVNTLGSGGGSIMIYGDSTYVGGQWSVYLIG